MIDFNIDNLIIEEDAKIALHQYYNTNSIDENALNLYFKAIFLGIVKKDSNIDMAIHSDTILHEDATLMVLGEYKELHKCFRI